MPELPEVERVRQGLARSIVGRTIVADEVIHKHFKPGRQPMPVGLVREVRRHGKWLLIRVQEPSETSVIAVNLGMAGRFALSEPRSVPKHTRWRLLLEYEKIRSVLNYVDPRCMGRLRILRGGDAVLALSRAAASRGIVPLNVGPDWLSPVVTSSGSVGVNAIREALCDTPKDVKRIMLDQSRLAGLGNIYASEACYLARVSPFRPAQDLTRIELKRLHRLVPDMLRQSIKLGGTSLGDANSYRDVSGAEGAFVDLLNVYGRAGQPCRGGCGGKVVKTKQAGRSTYHCPKCQP